MSHGTLDTVYSFVDGEALFRIGKELGVPYLNPRAVSRRLLNSVEYQSSGSISNGREEFRLQRVLFFDASPDEKGSRDVERQRYWDAIEMLPDTELGWGALRGEGVKQRQKRVDTLLSVRMLVGAFAGLFDAVLLVARDEDFVPAVYEVRRMGVRVILGLLDVKQGGISGELRRSADRIVELVPTDFGQLFIPGIVTAPNRPERG